VINLKTEAGRKIFYDLVKISDVVVDNFRPGVLERLQIDYATLSALNPRIISVRSPVSAPRARTRIIPRSTSSSRRSAAIWRSPGNRGARRRAWAFRSPT